MHKDISKSNNYLQEAWMRKYKKELNVIIENQAQIKTLEIWQIAYIRVTEHFDLLLSDK